MRSVISFFLAVLILTIVLCNAHAQKVNTKPAAKPFSFPMQLAIQVPFSPTAFVNGSEYHIFYELYLTNFNNKPVSLRQIKLLDAKKKNDEALIIFKAAQLPAMIMHVADSASGALTIAGGETITVFVEGKTDVKKPYPTHLMHRIIAESDSLDGAPISIKQSSLQVFGAPLQGDNWTAVDGPGNDQDNHHRRGKIVLDGRLINSRRYAIDWKKYKNNASFSGDSKNVKSYYCYGEPVFAVADGKVIKATDGLPDNVPGHGADFHPAIPLTFEKLAGNAVVIDLGNGHYAHYMHLQPGSVLAKNGDRVRKGTLLGRIGASGDAREPHLHFEVTTSSRLLYGEGVPYLINHYRSGSTQTNVVNTYSNQLPINGQVVSFETK